MVRVTHERGRFVRVAIALTTACLFVACGLLGMQHHAEVAHVRDAETGVSTHGLETECHDSAPATHLHERPAHEHEADSCVIADVLSQSVRVTNLIVACDAPEAEQSTAAPSLDVVVHDRLLLTAPKTSPPVRA